MRHRQLVRHIKNTIYEKLWMLVGIVLVDQIGLYVHRRYYLCAWIWMIICRRMAFSYYLFTSIAKRPTGSNARTPIVRSVHINNDVGQCGLVVRPFHQNMRQQQQQRIHCQGSFPLRHRFVWSARYLQYAWSEKVHMQIVTHKKTQNVCTRVC